MKFVMLMLPLLVACHPALAEVEKADVSAKAAVETNIDISGIIKTLDVLSEKYGGNFENYYASVKGRILCANIGGMVLAIILAAVCIFVVIISWKNLQVEESGMEMGIMIGIVCAFICLMLITQELLPTILYPDAKVVQYIIGQFK